MNWQAPPKPAEVAESRLITAILSGHFPIGQSLPSERELAGQLGVTRPTLREALQRMARDGWIDIQQGRPTRVQDFWREGNLGVLSGIARFPEHAPEEFVPNLLTIRLLMAPTYFRLAVENDLQPVEALLRQIGNVDESPASFAQADWRLHHRLTVLSGNPIFTLILNGFKQLYSQMALVYFELADARIHSRRFYGELLQATTDQQYMLVEELTRQVMSDSCELWLKAAGGQPFSELESRLNMFDELGADAGR
ncbi:MAG: fatty acid metabolism transcriptional regulator FadR [Chloroflexota bacterium]|nr:MAG: fatty acid metabolism transcriptional regulator FadR [Chloroflexota bacterium]